MSMVIPTQTEKCKGAMLATAIGDALGWPNEPRSKNRAKKHKDIEFFVEWTRSSKVPRWHDEKILPGEYSDDTQLTLSVARSIIMGDWEKFFAEKELPFWLEYERGGGGALLKAARSCKKGLLLWQSSYTRDYFQAGGNGAVMRILPHVIAYAKKTDTVNLMRDVIKDTLITHGHPRAFLGATCYACALDYLLRKETVLEYGELVTVLLDRQNVWGMRPDPDDFEKWLNTAKQHCDYDFISEWDNVRGQMVRQLEFIRESLKKGLLLDDTKVLAELGCFGNANGAGDVAALSAVYLASRYANNPMLGVKVPAFLDGADTDTVASITGGLLGMLSGTNWIPTEWRVVQDYDCLIQMTELLLADNKKEATKKEVEEAKAQNDQWNDTLIGKMRLIGSKSVPNGKHGTVMIQKWQTTLGQTLYTKIFQQNEIESPQAAKSVQQSQDVSKDLKQVVLNVADIEQLLGDSRFKPNITIGKVLKIVMNLMEGKETHADISRRFKVDQTVVDLIGKYV